MKIFEGLTIDQLLQEAADLDLQLDDQFVRDAYAFAEEAHEGKLRYEQPYIVHPLETAHLMLPLKPDTTAVVACLLHDVSMHMKNGMAEIKKRFGSEVYNLVNDAVKLKMVKLGDYQHQVDTWRRMFLAMAKDIRVVFIRLADRLHNMMTLEVRDEETRKRMAQETMDVYAPIASRLGMYRIKGDLEDLAFRHLHPDEYALLSDEVQKYGEMHQGAIDHAVVEINDFLKKQGLEAKVKGRVKHIHSIHNKMHRKGLNSLSALYDIYALRVILPDQIDTKGSEDVAHLYSVLGLLHQKWTPLPHRFKDYVAVPKPNGYRSLHTAVMGLMDGSTQPVEVQIRNALMHDEAKYGIAAHWWYKEGTDLSKKVSSDEFQKTMDQHKVINKFQSLLRKNPDLRQKAQIFIRDLENIPGQEIREIEAALRAEGLSADELDTLRKSRSKGMLMTRHKFYQNQLEWIDALSSSEGDGDQKLDLFSDRIFVLTPKGEVRDLPRGATPIDFAYSIHSDVGHRCHQAKADGRIVPLDYELQNGEVVDIMMKKDPEPNRYWLSFVKTNAAAARIKNWFKTFDRDKNVKEGRELLNKYLDRLGKPVLGPKLSLLKKYGGKRLTLSEREDVLELVGNGTLTIGNVIKKIFPEGELVGEKKSDEQKEEQTSDSSTSKDLEKLVLVGGHNDLPIVLSACCKPVYGQDIIGFVTRGKQVRIHRKSCDNLLGLDEDRFVSAEWKSKLKQHSYQAELNIRAKDRRGLLSDIATAIDSLQCNISNIAVDRDGDEVKGRLAVEIAGYDELERVLDRIEGVMGVIEVSVN